MKEYVYTCIYMGLYFNWDNGIIEFVNELSIKMGGKGTLMTISVWRSCTLNSDYYMTLYIHNAIEDAYIVHEAYIR